MYLESRASLVHSTNSEIKLLTSLDSTVHSMHWCLCSQSVVCRCSFSLSRSFHADWVLVCSEPTTISVLAILIWIWNLKYDKHRRRLGLIVVLFVIGGNFLNKRPLENSRAPDICQATCFSDSSLGLIVNLKLRRRYLDNCIICMFGTIRRHQEFHQSYDFCLLPTLSQSLYDTHR